jgi:hypothetical protein
MSTTSRPRPRHAAPRRRPPTPEGRHLAKGKPLAAGKHLARQPRRVSRHLARVLTVGAVAVAAYAGSMTGVLGPDQPASAMSLPPAVVEYERSHRIPYTHCWKQSGRGNWSYRGAWRTGGRCPRGTIRVGRDGVVGPMVLHRQPLITGISSSCRWTAAEWKIIRVESGGNVRANNPRSTAFGLGQLLYENRVAYIGKSEHRDTGTTNKCIQLRAFRAYVRDRYGNINNAVAFWNRNHWY